MEKRLAHIEKIKDISPIYNKKGEEMRNKSATVLGWQCMIRPDEFKVGDLVTTWHHPCFWEYYDIPEDKLVSVPEVSSKYILQPTACVLNAIMELEAMCKSLKTKKILVVGCGFMAYTFKELFKYLGIKNVDFLANYNKSYFDDAPKFSSSNKYDVVVYTSVNYYYDLIVSSLKVGGIFCHYSTPRFLYETNFFEWNWKNLKVLFPSPRGEFYKQAVEGMSTIVDSLDFRDIFQDWNISEVNDVFAREKEKKSLVKNSLIFS